MKIESFEARLTELNLTKKEFSKLVGAVYNGVVNWNTKGETAENKFFEKYKRGEIK